ncbi:unnamed protein product [Rhodiola kirilowii]
MEGRNPGSEGSEAEADQGGDGFTDESMRRSGMGGQESYPERPYEADCRYYLRTGVCGYGAKCRFNHPPDRSAVVGALRLGGGEYPERVGQPVCKYYMMTKACKFGSSCKYHHPRHGGGTQVSFNYLGYPLRPGEKECAYYVKTGHCKFGVTCKFHHPQPTSVPVTSTSPAPGISPGPAPGMYTPVQPSQPYGAVLVVRPPSMLPGPYLQGPYTPMLLPHSMVPVPGWGHFPAHVNTAASPIPQPTMGSNPFYLITQLSYSAPEYARPYSSASLSVGPSSSGQKDRGFPERPGQPDCQYYMKTGGCKYGSSCRYHHAPELIRPKTNSETMNLPIRPGAPPCINFAQYGVCKFGSTCKYDHTSRFGTLSYSPSASSLTEMPVAPLPVGSSSSTLAASSSSSDFHQDIVAVSRKDSSPTPTSSSAASKSPSLSPTPLKKQTPKHSIGIKSSSNEGRFLS